MDNPYRHDPSHAAGRPNGEAEPERAAPPAAAAQPELCYAAGDVFVTALHLATGEVAWRTRLPGLFGRSILPMVVDGDRLLVAKGKEVSCLDRFTGQVRWTQKLPKGHHLMLATVNSSGGGSTLTAGAAALHAAQQAAAAASG